MIRWNVLWQTSKLLTRWSRTSLCYCRKYLDAIRNVIFFMSNKLQGYSLLCDENMKIISISSIFHQKTSLGHPFSNSKQSLELSWNNHVFSVKWVPRLYIYNVFYAPIRVSREHYNAHSFYRQKRLIETTLICKLNKDIIT